MSLERELAKRLGPLAGRPSVSRHRHRPTQVVGGRTMHNGWEVARCSCGRVFRRDRRNRWFSASPEWIAENVEVSR